MALNIKLQLRFLLLLLILTPTLLYAGPPYTTDDPEPVEYHGWEVYLASMSTYTRGFSLGTLPHLEANYGPLHDVQLATTIPMAFYNTYGMAKNYGPGNIQIAIKYRFIHETKFIPQVAFYPQYNIPVGNLSEGLGNGNAQYFLPFWVQKSFGEKWQTYGGGGYWINKGPDNQNWSFFGWQAQYQVSKNVNIGAEVYYQSSSTVTTVPGLSGSFFNFGSIIDLTENSHIVFSAGRSINGGTQFQAYVGYLFTFSKEKEKSSSFYQGNKMIGRPNING